MFSVPHKRESNGFWLLLSCNSDKNYGLLGHFALYCRKDFEFVYSLLEICRVSDSVT